MSTLSLQRDVLSVRHGVTWVFREGTVTDWQTPAAVTPRTTPSDLPGTTILFFKVFNNHNQNIVTCSSALQRSQTLHAFSLVFYRCSLWCPASVFSMTVSQHEMHVCRCSFSSVISLTGVQKPGGSWKKACTEEFINDQGPSRSTQI